MYGIQTSCRESSPIFVPVGTQRSDFGKRFVPIVITYNNKFNKDNAYEVKLDKTREIIPKLKFTWMLLSQRQTSINISVRVFL